MEAERTEAERQTGMQHIKEERTADLARQAKQRQDAERLQHDFAINLDYPHGSYSSLQHAFKPPDGADPEKFLAGKRTNWLVDEIQVFGVVFEPVKSQMSVTPVLAAWLGKSLDNCELVFSAQRDGWSSSAFHSKCDHKGATLTIVYTKDGHIFGGYASVAWGSYSMFRKDEKAFLFSVTDGNNRPPQKCLSYQNVGNAVYHACGYGPCFGKNHDLLIDLDNPKNSYSNLGSVFTVPAHQHHTDYFAGTATNWDMVNVEVFLV